MLNKVTLLGTVSKAPELLYTNKKGQSKYQFFIDCERKSGVIDTIPVICHGNDLKVGEEIEVGGTYSSFNKLEDNKSRLKLHVHAVDIQFVSLAMEDINEIELEGTVCKKPIVRSTPFGKDIADILLAVNRPNTMKSDYIPIIVWSGNAKKAENFDIGTKLYIKGRIQSRQYTKEEVEHTAYEVSAGYIEILENTEI